MNIVINEDLTATITSHDGLLECHFPAYNVETLEPFTTKEAAMAQAMSVQGREGLFLTPKPVPVGNLSPSAPEFLLMLTLEERIAIRKARAQDLVVEDVMAMIEDPRLKMVDLTHPSVIEGVKYFTQTTPPILTQARAQRILAGLDPEVVA